MSEAKDTPPGSSRPQRAAAWEPSALRQIRESAQALREEGKVEEAFEFFLSALEAVLHKTRELELLVAKRRREGVGKRSERIDPGPLQLLFEALCRQRSEGDPTAAIDAGAEAREDVALDQEIREAEQTRNPEKRPGERSGPPPPDRKPGAPGSPPRGAGRGAEVLAMWRGPGADRRGCDADTGVCPGALHRARTPARHVCLREVPGGGDDGAGAGEDHGAQPRPRPQFWPMSWSAKSWITVRFTGSTGSTSAAEWTSRYRRCRSGWGKWPTCASPWSTG